METERDRIHPICPICNEPCWKIAEEARGEHYYYYAIHPIWKNGKSTTTKHYLGKTRPTNSGKLARLGQGKWDLRGTCPKCGKTAIFRHPLLPRRPRKLAGNWNPRVYICSQCGKSVEL